MTTSDAVNTTTNNNNNNDDMEIWPVDLPRECQWKRLDGSGPWREYVDADVVCSGSFNSGDGSDIGDGTLGCCYASRIKEFMPTDVIAIDWHGMLAWEAIHSTLSQDAMMVPGEGEDELLWQPANANVCYYNLRVYYLYMWDHPPTSSHQQPSNNEAVVKQSADGEDDNDDDLFYKEKEQITCRLANMIICLSEHDKCML